MPPYPQNCLGQGYKIHPKRVIADAGIVKRLHGSGCRIKGQSIPFIRNVAGVNDKFHLMPDELFIELIDYSNCNRVRVFPIAVLGISLGTIDRIGNAEFPLGVAHDAKFPGFRKRLCCKGDQSNKDDGHR